MFCPNSMQQNLAHMLVSFELANPDNNYSKPVLWHLKVNLVEQTIENFG